MPTGNAQMPGGAMWTGRPRRKQASAMSGVESSEKALFKRWLSIQSSIVNNSTYYRNDGNWFQGI